MTKNKTNKLFTPVDGVVVKIEKEINIAGIEIAGDTHKKNEGIIVSQNINITNKIKKEFGELLFFKKGTKIKFTEGYALEDNLLFVKLNKIIGIYN